MASKAEEAVTKAREYEAQVDVAIEEIFRKGIYRINNRPRKVLGWKTAQECFAEELRNSA